MSFPLHFSVTQESYIKTVPEVVVGAMGGLAKRRRGGDVNPSYFAGKRVQANRHVSVL
jgi:hypothetical protein